jgi:hypothetical protein
MKLRRIAWAIITVPFGLIRDEIAYRKIHK